MHVYSDVNLIAYSWTFSQISIHSNKAFSMMVPMNAFLCLSSYLITAAFPFFASAFYVLLSFACLPQDCVKLCFSLPQSACPYLATRLLVTPSCSCLLLLFSPIPAFYFLLLHSSPYLNSWTTRLSIPSFVRLLGIKSYCIQCNLLWVNMHRLALFTLFSGASYDESLLLENPEWQWWGRIIHFLYSA